MSKQQMQHTGDLTSENNLLRRAIPQTIDDPTAHDWLPKMNSVTPEHPATPTIHFRLWLASGIVISLLAFFAGVGSVFISPQPAASTITFADTTGCGAQTWWNRVNNMFAVMSFNSLLSQRSNSDFSYEVAAIRSQRDVFNTVPYPDCVVPARDELLAGTEQLIDGLENFTWDGSSTSMQSIYNAMLAYQSGALKLQALGVNFDPYVDQNLAALTSDCPALLWITENMFVKNHFFDVIQRADSIFYQPDPASAMQSFVFDLSGEQIALKYTTAPPCLQSAKAHMSTAMEAFIQTYQAYSARDPHGMVTHLETLGTELRAFGEETKALGIPIALNLEEE